ncbi:PAS domain-containing protein [Aureococcus anophagefferens]|nr:PAS domain-containing protein [Aureococcus anophagefferens]
MTSQRTRALYVLGPDAVGVSLAHAASHLERLAWTYHPSMKMSWSVVVVRGPGAHEASAASSQSQLAALQGVVGGASLADVAAMERLQGSSTPVLERAYELALVEASAARADPAAGADTSADAKRRLHEALARLRDASAPGEVTASLRNYTNGGEAFRVHLTVTPCDDAALLVGRVERGPDDPTVPETAAFRPLETAADAAKRRKTADERFASRSSARRSTTTAAVVVNYKQSGEPFRNRVTIRPVLDAAREPRYFVAKLDQEDPPPGLALGGAGVVLQPPAAAAA